MNQKLLTILIALIVFAIVVAPVAAAPALKRIISPSLVSPANNAQFTNAAPSVMLVWQPVSDVRVSGYAIEAQGWSGPWDLWQNFSSLERFTTDPWYQLDIYGCCNPAEGFYQYRWRVTAVSSQPGSNSAPSGWNYFSFPSTENTDVRLATIRLVSPANKAKFSSGDLQSYEWQTVPGGHQYLLIHEKMTADKQWTTRGGNPTIVFGSNPVFPYTTNEKQWCTVPGMYRWSVFTYDGSGAWSGSPWRTYTIV